MKDLLKTSDLTANDLHKLLDLSAAFKKHPLMRHGTLQGESVVLYFAKPSTRTRLSFETAVIRLGGVPLTVGTHELQVGRGETFEDTAKVVSRYSAAFVIRTYAHDDVKLMAEASTIPVINALTDTHHPCQSLADLLTLKEQWGKLPGHKLAYVGCGTNVSNSLMQAAALSGIEFVIATPPQYAPDPDIVAGAQAIAATTGGSVTVTHDPWFAVYDADAVYTDAWMSMGDNEAERAAKFAALTPYRVTPHMLGDAAKPGAAFLHCLPAHRGEEVSAEVIDGPQSVVFDQAENRLHTSQALLYALTKGLLSGSTMVETPVATPAKVSVAAD